MVTYSCQYIQLYWNELEIIFNILFFQIGTLSKVKEITEKCTLFKFILKINYKCYKVMVLQHYSILPEIIILYWINKMCKI